MAACLSDDDDEPAEGNLLGQELLCCVCRGLYQDPVRLPCEHSFCSACIERVFAEVGAGSEYRCPVCRESYQSKPAMTKHLVLTRLVEAYRKTKDKERHARSGDAEDLHDAVESVLGARGCRLHRVEEVTHLCFEEWELLCPLCVSSDRHQGHTAKPLGEVSKDWKNLVPDIVESLECKTALLNVQILKYTELEEKAKGEISDAKAGVECEIDCLIEFLQNEKDRLAIDIQHAGNEHLDTIHVLQAQATLKLEDCKNTMQWVQEASSVRDQLAFVKGMMDFMQRMETLADSPEEEEIGHPSLDLEAISFPSVLRTWKNEEGEEEAEDDEE